MNTLADYKFIDIHYHARPDLYERRWDAIEAGNMYQTLKGAVVLKSHLGATSVQASLAQRMGLPVFPSLVLNAIAGGIDYRVILRALSEYQPLISAKMIVHFPTITGRAFQSKLSRQVMHPYLSQHSLAGETLSNGNHQLRKEVIDILKVAKDYPIVLSTGHASRDEVYHLIDACGQHNVHTLLINEPSHPLMGLSAVDLKDLVENEFVWIEQTTLTYLLGHQDKEDFSAILTSLPRVIYSSDLGQTTQMDVTAWLNYSDHLLSELGLSDQRKDDLIRLNAIKLLSI